MKITIQESANNVRVQHTLFLPLTVSTVSAWFPSGRASEIPAASGPPPAAAILPQGGRRAAPQFLVGPGANLGSHPTICWK